MIPRCSHLVVWLYLTFLLLHCRCAPVSDECAAESGANCDPSVDAYYYAATIEDDMRPNDLLTEVAQAQEARQFRDYIGTASGLTKGALLVHQSSQVDETDPRNHAVVVLTDHGGHVRSKGFMVNEKLNEEESSAARKVLHRAGMEESNLSQDLLRSWINKRVWLGVGGPSRNDEDLWMHVHTCTGYDDVESLSETLGYAGDILHILRNVSCAPIKLLYGAFQWPAGKLGERY